MSTKKTVARALRDSNRKEKSDKRPFDMVDIVTVATTDIDDNDIISTRIIVPTNAEIRDVFLFGEDLDSGGTALAVDIGFYAVGPLKTITSGTVTNNADGAVLDRDALVAATTTLSGATTKWTQQALAAATAGVTKSGKSVWEILGYDEDPHGRVEIAVTVETAATTAAAGTFGIRVVGVA